MFLPNSRISREAFISEIVKDDYRTAAIFRNYGISYCCGGKWPLEDICKNMGIDSEQLITDLYSVTRSIHIPPPASYESWNLDFLTHYTLRIYHSYFREEFPEISELMAEYIEKHKSKEPDLADMILIFKEFSNQLIFELAEEESMFSYIRQVERAYKEKHKDQFGILLVRSINKPLAGFIDKRNEWFPVALNVIREQTHNYSPGAGACSKKKVLWSRLQNLDNVLTLHYHILSEILFPKAVKMQQELGG